MNAHRLWLLILAIGVSGCVEIEGKLRDSQAALPSATPPPKMPVNAAQVTPANAREMAHALWDEIDREELERDRQNLAPQATTP